MLIILVYSTGHTWNNSNLHIWPIHYRFTFYHTKLIWQFLVPYSLEIIVHFWSIFLSFLLFVINFATARTIHNRNLHSICTVHKVRTFVYRTVAIKRLIGCTVSFFSLFSNTSPIACYVAYGLFRLPDELLRQWNISIAVIVYGFFFHHSDH